MTIFPVFCCAHFFVIVNDSTWYKSNKTKQSMTWSEMSGAATVYRLIWSLVNILLIIFVVVQWWNMDTNFIKIDIANIQKQTGLIVGDTKEGKELRETFGFKTGGQDFCTWLAHENTTALTSPFDTFKCLDTSVSLNTFAKDGIAANDVAPKKNVWNLYTEAELFLPGESMKTPNSTVLTKYLKDNAIYTGPRACKKELEKIFGNQIWLGSLAVGLLLAHVAFAVYYKKEQSKNAKIGMNVALIAFSFIVYGLAIWVYTVQDKSKLFSECSWMSNSFQDPYVNLYGLRLAHVILGSIGLAWTVIFIIIQLLVVYGQIDAPEDDTTYFQQYLPVPNIV